MELDLLYGLYLKSSGVTTDSRQEKKKSLFFALAGDKVDGHDFVAQALESGAMACVIEKERYAVDERCVLVDNVLQTLQQLATCHRSHLTIPILGITGTNGKTTTKELTNAVLSKKFKAWCTQGNYNNHLGVPLTILSTPHDAEFLIVEMGANHPGEIAFLCNIAQPTHGLITNVGVAHLQGFGSFEGVVNTKSELYNYLHEHGGVVFVSGDNEILIDKLRNIFGVSSFEFKNSPVVSYGKDDTSSFVGVFHSANPMLSFSFCDKSSSALYKVESHLLGDYNFYNALAASSIGQYFGVAPTDIVNALENYMPTNNRSQLTKTASNTIIMDCYNANPSSMSVALNNFAHLDMPNKVVILGGMKELGSSSKEEHAKLMALINGYNFCKLGLRWEEFECWSQDKGVLWFSSSEEVKHFLHSSPIKDSIILLKGSNSNRVWIIADEL